MMNRKLLTRVGALVLILTLLMSFTACFAASFTASKAGIRGAVVGKTLTKSMKGYKRTKYDGCTCGVASYRYRGNGLTMDTLQKKKGGSEYVMALTITSGKTLSGLKIGDKVARMEKIYGKGYSKSGSTYTYHAGSRTMKVRTKSGKVTKISFE